MINFRFHLVSLVAVFLAIGVGVAMGASFVDRATVETLRDRLDQLEVNYRKRGGTIEELRTHLRATDELDEQLLADGSAAIAGRLAGRRMVVIAPEEIPDDALDATWAALEAAGAVRTGTIRVAPTISLDDEGALARSRDLLELQSATPGLVRGRLLTRLASSLSVLTASEPGTEPGTEPDAPEVPELPASPDGTTPEGTPPPEGTTPQNPTQPPPPTSTTVPEFRPMGPAPTAEEVSAARTFLNAVEQTGVLSIALEGVAADARFPAVDEVTYVMLLTPDTTEEVASAIHRLTKGIADVAPATVTVGEISEVKGPGELPAAEVSRVGATLADLRSDDALVDRLSTVDGLAEVPGRLALVLAVEEQLAGSVGHYGTGEGATGAFPNVAP